MTAVDSDCYITNGGIFWGRFLSANLMESFFSVSDMDRQNILKALYALKNIVFVEKKNVATKISAEPQTKKPTTMPPPPLS